MLVVLAHLARHSWSHWCFQLPNCASPSVWCSLTFLSRVLAKNDLAWMSLAVLLQQKWSPINVPLIWGAAGTDETTPVFEWLMGEASRVPDQVQFHDGHTDVCNAVREGWHALREVMRMWGIEDRSDLSEWLGRRGFPRTTAGNHISARVQEVVLSEASAIDAQVALVEAACGDHSVQRTCGGSQSSRGCPTSSKADKAN